MSYEQKMVDKFKANYSKIIFHKFSVCSKKYPDVVFETSRFGKQELYVLEAKVCNLNNSGNYPKQIIAEILKNRKDYILYKNDVNPNRISIRDVYFSFIIDFDNKSNTDLHNKLISYYRKTDWMKFNKNFKCRYMFFYDRNSDELYYLDWDLLHNNIIPLKF
ncbi:MAG: hypothetical protein WC479_01540 [Candidatus Izemoplasmatales bacterium]|jgi:hypothetical protein